VLGGESVFLVLGITGGIATGKSTVTRSLAEKLQAQTYDTDAAARRFIQQPDVLEEIKQVFGATICFPDGTLNRALLRERVFANPSLRRKLEEILHPRIRKEWMELAAHLRKEVASGFLLVEIPLLFETGAQRHFDRIITTACGRDEQIRRLVNDRGLEPSVGEKILKAQLDLTTKIEQAHHVIWTGGVPVLLETQCAALALYLSATYV
jgi:dephospho-CoA kinase